MMIRWMGIIGIVMAWAMGCEASHPSPPLVMFLGDSLTAGYQLKESDAFPAQLQHRVGTANMIALNRGVSGDTSLSLLNRLSFSLRTTPDAVFLCIGGNDGLRGIPVDETKTAIRAIIDSIKQQNIPVIIAGITLPANYTTYYIDAFNAIMPDLAKEYDIPIMPFLLKGVAGNPDLNLRDHIHPNQAGHKKIAQSIHEFLVEIGWLTDQNEWRIPPH